MNENACGWMKNVFGMRKRERERERERISRMGNFERIFLKKKRKKNYYSFL